MAKKKKKKKGSKKRYVRRVGYLGEHKEGHMLDDLLETGIAAASGGVSAWATSKLPADWNPAYVEGGKILLMGLLPMLANKNPKLRAKFKAASLGIAGASGAAFAHNQGWIAGFGSPADIDEMDLAVEVSGAQRDRLNDRVLNDDVLNQGDIDVINDGDLDTINDIMNDY